MLAALRSSALSGAALTRQLSAHPRGPPAGRGSLHILQLLSSGKRCSHLGRGCVKLWAPRFVGAASRWCLDRCAQFVIQGCFLHRHTQQIQPQISASSSFLSFNPSFHPRFNPSFCCFTYNNSDSDVFSYLKKKKLCVSNKSCCG